MTKQAEPSILTREEIADLLAQDLLLGGLEPGTKLPSERQLAQRLGVSRPLVREALRSLVEHGLIQIAPGRGAFVREASTTLASRPLEMLYRRRQVTPRDLQEARMMVEPVAARLACARADAEEIETLAATLARFDAASDVVERARWDVTMHALIARMSHNPVIEMTFSSMATLVFELLIRSLSDPAVTREGAPYHQLILAAIRARDAERARQAMIDHLEVANRNFGDDLDRSLDLVARRELERVLGRGVSLGSILDGIAAGPFDVESIL